MREGALVKDKHGEIVGVVERMASNYYGLNVTCVVATPDGKFEHIPVHLFGKGEFTYTVVEDTTEELESAYLKLGSNVEHPAHYNQGGIEAIDIIKAALTPEEYAGFCKGNVLKYIIRERHKNGLEDVLKTQKYLEWLVENYEKTPD